MLITWGLLSMCLGLTATNIVRRLTTAKATTEVSQPEITVAVSGAVKSPGTYTLPWGARLEDALRAAGGATPYAEQSLINPAAPLDMGETVFIPSIQADTGEARVSLNSSSALELETLRGGGPAMASRIIQGRPYSELDDLLEVKGIGPKTLEKLRDKVKL